MEKTNNCVFIGVAGSARVGKNLFCDLVIKQLKQKYNLKARQFALAAELKSDCQHFIHEHLQLNVFTENTKEKTLFRDMLVWYGDVKRQQTQGRYWIDKLENRIAAECRNDPFDIALISDIRYDFYDKDEVYWIQREKKGPLVYISKYTYGFPTYGRVTLVSGSPLKEKIFTDPANEHEMLNDPKLRKKADYLLEWEDISYSSNNSLSGTELLDNEYLNNSVLECLNSLQYRIIR